MLELINLTKVFNQNDAENIKVALDNVSLKIEEGEFVTIIGSNGSGKSTLMNIISGYYPPDEGSVIIAEHDVTNMKEYKRSKYLGRVFQDPMIGTASSMSIEENLELAMQRGKSRSLRWGFKKANHQLFIELLESLDLGLEKRLSQRVGLLSGGQRQAVTLIMATMQRPKLLLLDEHTAALDPKTAKKVLELTNKIVTEERLTTLMITHNMRDAIRYGNRLIMLNDGKIILDIKGKEKKELTIEQLLAKFDTEDVEITDQMLLAK